MTSADNDLQLRLNIMRIHSQDSIIQSKHAKHVWLLKKSDLNICKIGLTGYKNPIKVRCVTDSIRYTLISRIMLDIISESISFSCLNLNKEIIMKPNP